VPLLPSGLKFSISDDALFDHGGNWFHCPDGHFWYWVHDPDIIEPPFTPGDEIVQLAVHAPVPQSLDGVKQFIHVFQVTDEGKHAWCGEWLHTFPQFVTLTQDDQKAWDEWIATDEIQRYLQAAIMKCEHLASVSANSSGFAKFHSTPPGKTS
jgi:hypothetical protein